MLTGGDFNINYGPHYTGSLEEVLKQTMLHHEAIFRHQVYELHRLYRIQKTLMKDLSWKEFEKYTSWTANTKSTPLPFQDPQISQTMPGERIFSQSSMVGSTSTADWNLLEDGRGSYSKLRQKPLNLQLPADEYISSTGTESHKNGNLGPNVKESSGMKEFVHANCVPDPEELKLCIRTGGGTAEMGYSSRSWSNKEACLSTLYVIDSEESIERNSNEEVKPTSCLTSEAPTTFIGDKQGVRAHILSDPSFSGGLKEDIAHRHFTKNHSLANQNGSNQENKTCCSDTGYNECQSTGQFVSLFTSKCQYSLCETTHANLNKVKCDESSSFLGVPLLSFPSLTESPPAVIHGLANESNKGIQSLMISGRKKDDSFTEEASIVRRQDNSAYSTLMDSKGEVSGVQACNVSTKCRENSGNKVGVIDLERVPDDLVDHCEDFSKQDITLGKDVEFSLGLPNAFSFKDYQAGTLDVTLISKVASNELCTSLRCTDSPHAVDDAEVGHINSERSEEDTVSSGPFRSHAEVQAEHCKSSDATSKTNCWTDDNSCYTKDLRSGTVLEGELENSNSSALMESGATLIGSEPSETRSAGQGPFVETGVYTWSCAEERSSDRTKTEHQCDSQQQYVEREMDILVQKAAESLIRISLDNSFCPQDFFGEAGSKALEEEMNEQPQYSSDSFESMTLRLTECSADVDSVSSMLVEVNETDKGCGWKLKRGSRLKDFRKDILPGLVSLSRHEICEDINIIGAALRSKEYRKNRSRSIGDENWIVPVKGRRSKLNYIGRRNYY